MKKQIFTSLAFLSIGIAANGAWQLVFDGESGMVPEVIATKIWEPDAEIPGFVGLEDDPAPWNGDEGNQVLTVDHNNYETPGMESAYILLPEDIIDGSTVTLYWRWWMEKNGGHETAMCLTDVFYELPVEEEIANGYGNHHTWWRIAAQYSPIDFGYSGPNLKATWPINDPLNPEERFLGPKEEGWVATGTTENGVMYEPGIWMEVWYIADTANDIRREYYVQNDGIQKENFWAILDEEGNLVREVNYMVAQEGSIVKDYSGIYMVNWNRPGPDSGTQVYMDDLWIDYEGVNLTTPPHGKTRSGSLGTWAGYPITNAEGDVDTMDFLGWINVAEGDYVFSYTLDGWMYLPESNMTSASGAWTYIFK
jgi:hypothetical protein